MSARQTGTYAMAMQHAGTHWVLTTAPVTRVIKATERAVKVNEFTEITFLWA